MRYFREKAWCNFINKVRKLKVFSWLSALSTQEVVKRLFKPACQRTQLVSEWWGKEMKDEEEEDEDGG